MRRRIAVALDLPAVAALVPIAALALASLRPTGSRSGTGVAHTPRDTMVCRFCASDMPAAASYCTTCKKFQRFGDRIMESLSVSALIALLPTVALVAAFLNQNLIRPNSNLSAAISRCSADATILAFSNSGSRAAIVNSGEARMVGADGAVYSRTLRSPPDGAPPVFKAGDSSVVRFELSDPRAPDQTMSMPLLPDDLCRYEVTLEVLEFGGRTTTQKLGACEC